MKYIWQYLIPVYFNLLNGKLYRNGSYSAVVVYDGSVPPIATSQDLYVVLGERNTNQTENKCIGSFDCDLLVDIVYKGTSEGYGPTEDIANQILQLINTFKQPDCSPDFQVISTEVSIRNLAGLTTTDLTFRTLIRFIHKVKQL